MMQAAINELMKAVVVSKEDWDRSGKRWRFVGVLLLPSLGKDSILKLVSTSEWTEGDSAIHVREAKEEIIQGIRLQLEWLSSMFR